MGQNKKIGRPLSNNPKNKQLKIKMTEKDFSELQQIADEEKTTKTDIVMKGLKLYKSTRK